MIRTLAWKEYREQRPFWVALAGLGILAVLGLVQFFQPAGVVVDGTAKQPLVMFAVRIAVSAYGLLCGAILLAGERESGALSFLDALPAWRGQVWKTKLAAGAALTIGQTLLIGGVFLGFGFAAGPEENPWLFTAILMLVALEAFSWGLFFSAHCKSVLAAFTLSGLVLVFLWCLPTVLPHWLILGYFPLRLALWAGALWGSWRQFCGRDLERDGGAVPGPGWLVLVWLSFRQGRIVWGALGVAGLLLGFLVPQYGLVVWPVATMLGGVVCGVGVFAGDQPQGAYRFLGNQRLPPGRVWLVKTAAWFAGGVSMAALMLLVANIFLSITQQGSPNINLMDGRWLVGSESGLPMVVYYMGPLTFYVLWLICGFSVGQLCGLIVQRTAVSVVVAILVSPVIAGLWLPSLLKGGMHWWQVWPVVALLLLATRLTLWAWAANRLAWGKPATGLILCLLLAGAWLAGSLWYRVLEVPDVGEPFDVQEFVAGLPNPEQNKAGRLVLLAAREFAEQEQRVNETIGPPTRPLFPSRVSFGPGMAPERVPVEFLPGEGETYDQEISEVLVNGWPPGQHELGRWLDLMFEGEWVRHLRESATLKLGVVIDPQMATFFTDGPSLSKCEEAGKLLAVRAWQLQARGEHGAALDHLAVALALSRNLHHDAPQAIFRRGGEEIALWALDVWIPGVGPQPELLKRALGELTRHEAEAPPLTERVKADYIVARNALEDPSSRLFYPGSRKPWEMIERELSALALQAPWEKARSLRLLNATSAAGLRLAPLENWEAFHRPSSGGHLTRTESLASFARQQGLPPIEGPGASVSAARWGQLLEESRWVFFNYSFKNTRSCHIRLARLKLALVLYQVEHGKAAPGLDDLVRSGYLEKVPVDPDTGQSFEYRVSQGEQIPLPGALPSATRSAMGLIGPPEGRGKEEFTVVVQAGQGILWDCKHERFFLVPLFKKP